MNPHQPKTLPKSQSSGKFLTRHEQPSSLFQCCGKDTVREHEGHHQVHKTQPSKISIKRTLKKSAVFGLGGNSDFGGSLLYIPSNKSALGTPKKESLARYKSEQGEMNRSELSSQTPAKTPRKINFIYKEEPQPVDNSVHNYHTTNYIVEKYIVQPHEMNIYMKGQQDRPQPAHQKPYTHQRVRSSMNFHLRESFNKESPAGESPVWGEEPMPFYQDPFPKANLAKPELTSSGSLGTFSFGTQQKKAFMNKYMNFREAESNRPSSNSKESHSQPRSSIEQKTNSNEQFLRKKDESEQFFLQAGFKRQNLHALVRNADVFNQEDENSDSHQSEVIDNYQSMMSRMQEKDPNRRFLEHPF